MKDLSQKLAQGEFDSQQENKSRKNSICSEYYCWYGHLDCFSEGGRGRYSGGRSHRGNRPWRNSHSSRGRGGHRHEWRRNSWWSGENWNSDSAGSKRARLSIEEIKKQHFMKKREEAQDLAKEIAEKSEIADKAAKIKQVLGSLPRSRIFDQHQSQDRQQIQSSEPDKTLAVPTEKLIVLELVLTASDNAEVGKSSEEAIDDVVDENLIFSQPATQADFIEDELPALPRNDSMKDLDIIKQEVAEFELISEMKQEKVFECEPTDLNERCGEGQDEDDTLDLHVGCVGGDNAEVLEIPPPFIDNVCEEATTSMSSSLIVASVSSDPIDSATRLSPVYKRRGRPAEGEERMIGGHEVVIATVDDLVNVQENNRNQVSIENLVEINLDIETSPDESIEQDDSNKMKSFGLIFEQESRLLSNLESVDCEMASLAQERSSVMRQLLFLSKLKSQMLK